MITIDTTNMCSHLQKKLFEEISGVTGALQGKSAGVNSANVYQLQSENASIALSDVFETFEAFRRQRDRKIVRIIEDRGKSHGTEKP